MILLLLQGKKMLCYALVVNVHWTTNHHFQNKHILRVHIIIAKQWCLYSVMTAVAKQMLGYTRNESSMIQ